MTDIPELGDDATALSKAPGRRRRDAGEVLAVGDRLELDVQRLAYGGDGVGRSGPDQPVVFVPRTAPGDRARVEITEVHRRHARGRLMEVLSAGEARRPAPCPVYERCGGCQLMHLDDGAQREAKEEFIRSAMSRIGGIASTSWGGMVTREPLGYRNRLNLQWDAEQRRFGFVGLDDTSVVPMERCLLAADVVDRARQLAEETAVALVSQNAAWATTIRGLAVRAGIETGEAQVTLVLEPDAPGELLTQWAEALVDAELGGVGRVASVWGNYWNGRPESFFGETFVHLAGQETITEQIGGLRFLLDPRVFFQVNTRAARVMYSVVRENLALLGNEQVLDLYSGTGGISLTLAPHVAEVIGVEVSEHSVHLAQENARINGVENVEFHAWRVEGALRELHYRHKLRPDIVILNPPRGGVSRAVLRAMDRLRPRRIAYVSCNPTTLARDIKLLEGWVLRRLVPADLFPQTYHVESVAILERPRRDRAKKKGKPKPTAKATAKATAKPKAKATAKPKAKAKAKPTAKGMGEPRETVKPKPKPTGRPKARPKAKARAKAQAKANAKGRARAKAKAKAAAKATVESRETAKPKPKAKAKEKAKAKAKERPEAKIRSRAKGRPEAAGGPKAKPKGGPEAKGRPAAKGRPKRSPKPRPKGKPKGRR